MSSSRENIICPDFDLQLMGSEVLEVNSFIICSPSLLYMLQIKFVQNIPGSFREEAGNVLM